MEAGCGNFGAQDLRHVGPHEQIVCRRIVVADCRDEDSVPVRSPDNPVDEGADR